MSPGKIIAFVIALLTVINVVLIYSASGAKSTNAQVSFGMILSYIALGLTLLFSLLLAARGLIQNPKSGIRILVSLGILIAFLAIGYLMDDKEVTDLYISFGISTSASSGLVGGILTATWIVLGLTFLLAVGASLRDFIKRI